MSDSYEILIAKSYNPWFLYLQSPEADKLIPVALRVRPTPVVVVSEEEGIEKLVMRMLHEKGKQ